ncbi:MAG: response regulator [Eubacteriales bacterium]|nr:response regulator [Eubacteriales bacterium]
MYEVLIVDDELLVREGIKNSIDWEKNNFNIPKEAYNGSEAWNIIEASPIDVVITDIKMPGMDGIELIRKIRQLSKSIEIIILSCYNDFHYVQEALKLGACDYLFKLDMLSEDILKALQKAVERIMNQQSASNRIKALQKTISENISVAKEAFIIDMINGKKVSREEFLSIAVELGIKLDYNNLTIAIIKVDDLDSMIQNGFSGNEYSAKYSIMDTLRRTLTEYDKVEAVYKSIDEFLLLMNVEQGNSEKKRYKYCNEILSRVVADLEEEFPLRVTAGTSKRLWSLENLRIALKECAYAADKRYFTGTGRVIYYEDFVQLKEIGETEISFMLNEIRNCGSGEYIRSIKHIFGKIKLSYNCSMEDVIEISSNIVSILLKNISNHDSVIEELYKSEPYIYSSIYKINRINDIEAYLCQIASKIEDLLTQRYRNEIILATRYIEKNLGKPDLSLGEVAASVNLSKNYFSKIFKKNLGINFIDYLTSERIARSEELIRTTNLKVYQIAGEVGYSDWRYLCKIYKKRTGQKLTCLKR